MPHAELLAHLAPDEPLGTFEGRRGRDALLVVPEHRVEDRGVLGVPGDPDVGDRDEAEAGVLDPALQHLGDDHLDAVRDLAHSWACHGPTLSNAESAPWCRVPGTTAPTRVDQLRGISRISKDSTTSPIWMFW